VSQICYLDAGSALLFFLSDMPNPQNQQYKRWYLAFYVLIAILTKGPVELSYLG